MFSGKCDGSGLARSWCQGDNAFCPRSQLVSSQHFQQSTVWCIGRWVTIACWCTLCHGKLLGGRPRTDGSTRRGFAQAEGVIQRARRRGSGSWGGRSPVWIKIPSAKSLKPGQDPSLLSWWWCIDACAGRASASSLQETRIAHGSDGPSPPTNEVEGNF